MHAALEDGHMKSVEWETSRIHELDLASTELSSECLMDILCRMPGFTFLSLGYCEFFTDKVRSKYTVSTPVQSGLLIGPFTT